MKLILSLLFVVFFLHNNISAQLDSIYDQNVWRTFIAHLPEGYTSNNQYPIVLNLHGLSSNASHQQLYSQFDSVADVHGFIVIYPNGISNSWSTIGDADANFLSNLVDSVRERYSTNSCLFVMGMSQGGFMTYKFATATQHEITAIAVGSGNMSNRLQDNSSSAPRVSVMHFHGTADNIVSFDGTALISPVDSTIQWWVEHNNANPVPLVTYLEDKDNADSSTVEKYYYDGGVSGVDVTFYKIVNGGHTWSGGTSINLFGHTNQDIHQSTIIGEYFADFCSELTVINNETVESEIKFYPNPFLNQLTISSSNEREATFRLFNYLGQEQIDISFEGIIEINTEFLPKGVYFFEIKNSKDITFSGKLVKN